MGSSRRACLSIIRVVTKHPKLILVVFLPDTEANAAMRKQIGENALNRRGVCRNNEVGDSVIIGTVPVVMMRRRITVWRLFLGNPFLQVGDEATLQAAG